MIYLDNSATTQPYAEVTARMAEEERLRFGNASALYRFGMEAETSILDLKQAVAETLRCTPGEVLITTGGTFANNLAVIGGAMRRQRRGRRVVMTRVEHPSVYACGAVLQERGFEVVYVPPEAEALEQAINRDTVMVAVMMVNNETGQRLPVERVAGWIRRAGAPAHFHIDGVQAFCKIPADVRALGCDSFAVSAHKIKGPKGIGALYLRRGVRVVPILFGGAQEGGMVPGTYNSPAAAGFARAIALYRREDLSRFEALRARFLTRAKELPFLRINSPADGVPYILNVSCMGYLGENVLHYLEEREIYVSQGSACSAKKKRSESVLARMGLPEPVVMGALRISFGIENTPEEIDALADALAEVPQKIQKRYKDV
ncbi:MAG: cysteine desulfurase [Clostridiales bacterium]|nr:MAG: cysteine desulfurase [Clostridiales bacterium]